MSTAEPVSEAVTYLTTPGIDLFGPLPLVASPDRRVLARQAADIEALLKRASAAAKVVEIKIGPVLTTFFLELASGVRFRQVSALAEDLAHSLSVPRVDVVSRPGEALVALQVPDSLRRPVVISELLGGEKFASSDGELPIALGKDAFGDPVVVDLADLQHLLILGRQEAGKTNAVHAILQSLLFRFGTARLWLLIAGSRPTDFAAYERIPHMLGPVQTDEASLAEGLKWVAAQIDHRLRMLRSVSARSLVSYNRQIEAANERGAPLTWQSTPGDDSDLPFLSRIVVVVDAIDELSDGSAWPEEILDIVRRGAAVGLHLVVVSRSFSAKVLEQLLRQGTVARLCLQVPTARESQALLNVEGADLLGMNGDAYLLPSNGAPTRLHLPLVVEEEVGAVGEHWRSQGEPLNFAFPSPVRSAVGTATKADDELYARALEIVRTQGRASTSYVQRTLRIGYNSAAKLIDRMEREGHVGAPDAVGRREVLSASRRAVPREADNEAPKGRSWLPWRR